MGDKLVMVTKNINKQHKEGMGTLDRVAVFITTKVGTMWCAFLFAGLALISLPAAIQGGIATLIAWIAQTFLQLVLLPIIIVGQNQQAKHSELRAENDYEVNKKAEKEIEQLQTKLDDVYRLLLMMKPIA